MMPKYADSCCNSLEFSVTFKLSTAMKLMESTMLHCYVCLCAMVTPVETHKPLFKTTVATVCHPHR